MIDRSTPPNIVLGGAVVGFGLGGFIDGIVLHQLLQWHHMLTAEGSYPPDTVAGLETNTLWDGIFHATTWVFTVAGIFVLATASTRVERFPFKTVFGAMLVGWGAFNLADSVLNHFVLGIHHVRDDVDESLPWDLGFLASAFVLMLVGWLVVRASRGERAAITRAEPVGLR